MASVRGSPRGTWGTKHERWDPWHASALQSWKKTDSVKFTDQIQDVGGTEVCAGPDTLESA